MRSLFTTLASVALAVPLSAQAQDFNIYGGLAFTSDYIFRGQSQTDNDPAVQAYLEADYLGFYVGAWTSNVDFGDNNDYEVDLYFGYRNELSNGITYDIGYVRFYFDDTGDCCGEIYGVLGVPVAEQITLTGFVAYDESEENLAVSLTGEFAIDDKWTLSATIGDDDATDATFWDAGVNYAITDIAAVDLRYYDTDVSGERLVLAVTFDTTLFSR